MIPGLGATKTKGRSLTQNPCSRWEQSSSLVATFNKSGIVWSIWDPKVMLAIAKFQREAQILHQVMGRGKGGGCCKS